MLAIICCLFGIFVGVNNGMVFSNKTTDTTKK